MMSDAILVLNAGSSSIKFGLFDISGTEPRVLFRGLLDEHEAKPGFIVTDAVGNHLFEKRRAPGDNNGGALLTDILNWSNDYLTGGALVALGHRVVHGGRDLDGPVEVTDKTIEAMAALTPHHLRLCTSRAACCRCGRSGRCGPVSRKLPASTPPSIMALRRPSAALRFRDGSKRWASGAMAFTDFPLNSSPTAWPRSRPSWQASAL